MFRFIITGRSVRKIIKETQAKIVHWSILISNRLIRHGELLDQIQKCRQNVIDLMTTIPFILLLFSETLRPCF